MVDRIIAVIRTNPSLILHFEGEDGEVCPHRVERYLDLPGQEKGALIQRLIDLDCRMTEIDAEIYQLTQELRQRREEISAEHRATERQLKEMMFDAEICQTA